MWVPEPIVLLFLTYQAQVQPSWADDGIQAGQNSGCARFWVLQLAIATAE